MGNIISLFFPEQPAVSAKTQVDHLDQNTVQIELKLTLLSGKI